MQRFLPFLPADGASAGAGGEAFTVIEGDLEWLLTAPADELWAVAKTDSSLLLLIATFLQYARRPYDEGFQQQSATELAIWHRMLPLLHRLVCGEERGAPPKADRAGVLSRLLDFPRLLDICALYGAIAASHALNSSKSDAGSQVSRLVGAAVALLPRLGTQAAQAAPIVAQNLGQVAEACLTAAGKAAKEAEMMQSLQDGVAYLRDTCLTLASFIQAYPAAAALMLRQGPGLIEALGAVHDQLLPAVHKLARGSGRGANSPELLLLMRRACHVELAAERLVQQLLLHCYLQPAADGSGGSGAGSSTAGSSGGSAVVRGEALLQALMLLGHREEESGAGGGGTASLGTSSNGLSLGQALAQRFGLGGSIHAALLSGSASLDEAQADYVAALLGVASLAEAPGPPLPGGSRATNGIAGFTGAGGGTKHVSPASDLAALKLKIQQVRDLLPDYGDGFVAACLQQLGGSTERVINALLEGLLPAQLTELDPQLSLADWQAAADRGKRPSAPTYDSEFPVALPSSSHEGGGAALAAAASARTTATKAENKTARYLDVRDASYREALVTAASAAQWEYDDEWDDSMEDLVKFGAAGVAEIEEEEEAAGVLPPARGLEPRPTQAAGAGPSVTAVQRAMQGLALPSQPQAAGGGARSAAAAPGQQAGASTFQPGSKQQQRGPKAKGSKLWVLDGRIYNYAKPGAQEVGSREEADAVLAAAQQAAQAIMGLGPGGNKPWRAQEQQAREQPEGAEGQPAASTAGTAGTSAVGGRGSGAGGSSTSGGGGRGRGRHDHRYKDQHKAGMANHHRKDRAAAKQGRGLW